jgi:NADH-ubiquinone oxidoreductase chain 1
LESELVSGFMTEHAAVIFVFFFLAEYASIVLMCIFTSILFLGGYLTQALDYSYLLYNFYYLGSNIDTSSLALEGTALDYTLMREEYLNSPSFNGLLSSLILGIKSSAMVFTFIWVRASFPRIRFDQLMSFCWTVLLPILFGFIFLIPSILYIFGVFFININLI